MTICQVVRMSFLIRVTNRVRRVGCGRMIRTMDWLGRLGDGFGRLFGLGVWLMIRTMNWLGRLVDDSDDELAWAFD